MSPINLDSLNVQKTTRNTCLKEVADNKGDITSNSTPSTVTTTAASDTGASRFQSWRKTDNPYRVYLQVKRDNAIQHNVM
jgi:hypothetical protein